ncbi:MAG TPA: IS200/IS605 family transposase [Blastocatellia bacterium]|nr:IS200/IS605 family transposase [Blastocatellia bacterium]
MARNVYAEINLHFIWHTKLNAPVLTEVIENRFHHYLKHRVLETEGARFHEIGGAEDHVHLAVSVPPTLQISEWVGRLKGASAHYINHEIANRKLLEWQDGYGVVSFGTRDLPWVVSYIQHQREHHARGTTHVRLEKSVAKATGEGR